MRGLGLGSGVGAHVVSRQPAADAWPREGGLRREIPHVELKLLVPRPERPRRQTWWGRGPVSLGGGGRSAAIAHLRCSQMPESARSAIRQERELYEVRDEFYQMAFSRGENNPRTTA